MPEEPVFNTFRRQPLRPFFSLREFQIGLGTLVVLVAAAGWVVWRGAHPDPTLFAVDDQLLSGKGGTITVYERPVAPWVEPGSAASSAGPRLDPFPATVVSPGWRLSAPPQMFDEGNLYSKIDGRETFYKSYGFKKLHCLSLSTTEPAGLGIDLELFDLGSVQNALGALSAEISDPATVVTLSGQSLWYVTRNGGFLAQGRYYARLLGSDDHETVRQKIAGLRDALLASLPGESLPWAYELFVGRLRLSPSRIQYFAENAFSHGFANDFYAAGLPGGDAELFVSRRASDAAARELADKLAEGFAAYGQRVGDGGAADRRGRSIMAGAARPGRRTRQTAAADVSAERFSGRTAGRGEDARHRARRAA